MNTIITHRTGSLDLAPDAIGGLFRKAHATHIESVRLLIECGQRLKAKKDSLRHCEWLPWIEANRDTLGFGERVAQLLMKAVASNPQLTSDLTPADALRINRGIWGNSPEKKAARLTRQFDVEPDPAKAEPEAELPPEAHEIWEPDEDEAAQIELEEKAFRESIGNVMGANGEPVNAVDEIARQARMIGVLEGSRNWWIQEKSNIRNGLKEKICELRDLRKKLDKKTADFKRLQDAYETLSNENEALRERIAIMEESR